MMLSARIRLWLGIVLAVSIGAEICIADPEHDLDTQLFQAVAAGDVDSIRTLIGQGANVYAQNPEGLTPLQTASKSCSNPEVITVLLSAISEAKPSRASFFDVEANGDRFAYIVDVSGSMQGERIEILKRELTRSIVGLRSQSQFTILLFSSGAIQLGPEGWRSASDQGKRAARSEINNIQAGGTTVPFPAFEVLFEMRPRPDAIYFMTDGVFSNAEQVAAEIARLNRSTGRTVPIHCITFIEREAEEIMKQIAHHSGGIYTHIGVVDDATNGSSDKSDDRRPLRDPNSGSNLHSLALKSALFTAAKHNTSPSVLKALVDEGAQVRSVNEEGFTPLMVAAAFNESPQVIRQLLELGAEVASRDELGRTPLMMASRSNTNPEVIRFLLSAGASPDMRDLDGFSSLMYAARNNSNIEALQVLLAAGAEIDAKDSSGYTSLMYAIRNANTNTMAFLIRSGADVNAKSDNGSTALLLAAGYSEKSILVDMLLDAGADANARTKDGITPIMAAAFANDKDIVFQKLIEKGANVNAVSGKGGTALIAAAMKNENPKVLKILLDAGAEIDYRHRQSGSTALMAAAMSNRNSQVLLVLLENGANAKISDRSKKTALDYAKENEALKGTDAFWKLNDATFN